MVDLNLDLVRDEVYGNISVPILWGK